MIKTVFWNIVEQKKHHFLFLKLALTHPSGHKFYISLYNENFINFLAFYNKTQGYTSLHEPLFSGPLSEMLTL